MKVSRCCVAMSPPSFTAIQKVCLQTDFWLLPWIQMHVRLYRPKIVLGTTLQASNTSLLINPPRNPEYWYSTLKSGSMWMRLSELYFLHVQYNFKQSPLCESCQGPEWWQGLLISLVLLLNIYIFLIIWAASFFLSCFSFLFSFSFSIPRDTFWQSDRSREQNNFCHLCNTTRKINKLSYIYLTACCFGHYLSCYPCFLAI